MALEGKVSVQVGHNVVEDVFVGSEAKRVGAPGGRAVALDGRVVVCPALTRAVLLSSPLLARFFLSHKREGVRGRGTSA